MADDRLRLLLGHLDQPYQRLVRNDVAASAHLPSTTIQPIFKYTRDGINQKLTNEQRLFYEKNGYIVIKKLVDDQLLNRYRERFIDLCEGKVQSFGVTIMKDIALAKKGMSAGENTVNKIQDFVFDDVLFRYCQLPEILDYVECFTGPNIMAMHTMLINKPPDPGTLTSRHPLHQDLHYFPFRPASRIVCAWTAMEKVNRDNGCLVALPGTHTGELLNHGYPDWEDGVNLFYHGVSGINQSEIDSRVFLEMEKGDTVFFHPVLIHGSGANRTSGFRKAISCHYAASECNYIDIKGTSQEALDVEFKEFLKKRGLVLDDFSYIWRARRRLVRGEEINL